MPIYEYRCDNCSHQLEALQKMSDGPLRKCPSCGKSQLRRLVSAPSFRLKGGGWYETDFKGDGEKKRNLVESGGSEPMSDSGSAEKSEAKDAAKAAIADAKAPAADKKPADKPADKPKAKKSSARKKAPAKSRSKRSARG